MNQRFIGSRANGQLEDLRIAADMLQGQGPPEVRLIVTPASQAVYTDAIKAGYRLETLAESGAIVTIHVRRLLRVPHGAARRR